MNSTTINPSIELLRHSQSGKENYSQKHGSHLGTQALSPKVADSTSRPRTLSFVIPVKDESATLRELRDRIISSVPVGMNVEIIFIDDGSKDGSWKVIQELVDTPEAMVRGIRFRCNQGKAAALTAGFRAASGDIVFTMDADLQDDPAEIPAMLTKLNEGYDIVSGWKKVRHDPWHKVLPSRVLNWMVSKVCGVRLSDHNCGFKCYRAEVTRQLTIHGELHRMIPSIASIKGFRSTEIAVRHHPRRHGISKYGFERYIRGFMDMITIGFLKKFRERPSHFFGQMAFFQLAIGITLAVAGVVVGLGTLPGQAMTLLGWIMAIGTVPLFTCGLIAELVIRGGLAATWQLPLVDDTAFPEVSGRISKENRSPQPISVSYVQES